MADTDPLERLRAASRVRDAAEVEFQAAIIEALKAHAATEEIAEISGYSRQHIRRKAADAGLPPAKTGPKPLSGRRGTPEPPADSPQSTHE